MSTPSTPQLLSEVNLQMIFVLGEEQRPLEACGIICPDGMIIRLTNWAETPEREFLIHAEDVQREVAAFIERNDMVFPQPQDFVIWHTHPSGSSGPSDADIEAARPPFQYLVVALPHGPATFYTGRDLPHSGGSENTPAGGVRRTNHETALEHPH